MNRREQIVENCEDAFMALFMADVAEYEGKQYLEENEQLKNDETFVVPSELDRRCLRTIRKAERKKRMRCSGKKAYSIFSKISVAAVIVLALFTSAYAAFPEVRVSTLNLLIEVSDIATKFTFGGADGEPNVIEAPRDTMPEANMTIAGYKLPISITSNYHLSDEGSSEFSEWALFSGLGNSVIYIDVQEGEDNAVNINTEDAISVQQLDIGNFKGIIVQQDEVVVAGVADKNRLNYILITFEGVSFESSIQFTNEFLSEN